MISHALVLLKLPASPLNNNGYNLLVSRACTTVSVRLTSCGMIESLDRRSLSPIEAISMLHSSQFGLNDECRVTYPSISMEPDVSSTMRNSASMSDDLPAPVLRKPLAKLSTGGLLAYSPPNDSNLFSSSDAQ